MKVQSVKIITTGYGKNGQWTLVEASFDGKEGTFKGFYYDKPFQIGSDVDVEFSQEEYKGKMEPRFKLSTQKKAPQNSVNEMAIKMEVGRYGQEILRKLDLIMAELKVKDIKAELEKVRNEEPMTPTWESPDYKGPGLDPADIPF